MEAPWSSGERQGLTVWAMVLGRGFNSRVHLKTRWATWWQKKNENNKDSQKGKSHQKKLIKRWLVDYWFHSCKWIFLALKVDLFLKHKSLTFSNCFINLYQFLFEEKNDCEWNVLRLKGENLLRIQCYKTFF